MPTGKNTHREKGPQGKMPTGKKTHRGKMPTRKNAHMYNSFKIVTIKNSAKSEGNIIHLQSNSHKSEFYKINAASSA